MSATNLSPTNTSSNIAVVLVTRNSERFLADTLVSIDSQSRATDFRIAVDDLSTDQTPKMLAAHGFSIQRATSSATDRATRIAQNFVQGIREAARQGADLVVLGDHDDVWHRNRIEHQVHILEQDPSIAMVASDGFLIDEHGAAIAGTIRGTFPVPEDFNDWSLRKRLSYAAQHSIATGGASALRLAALADWSVPSGWLHDRWWSVAALRADRFVADQEAVIDYRLSPDQEVGLDSALQNESARWFAKKARSLGGTAGKARDLARLMRPQ